MPRRILSVEEVTTGDFFNTYDSLRRYPPANESMKKAPQPPTDTQLAEMIRDMWRRDLAEFQRLLQDNPSAADEERYRHNAKFFLECLREDDAGVFRRIGCNGDDTE